MCRCREQAKPLEHQTSLSCFLYSKWQCSYNTGNLKPSTAYSSEGASTSSSPAFHHTLLLDTEPPPPAPELRARERVHGGVSRGWKEEVEGACRDTGRGQAGSCSLSDTDKIHIRSSVIKKQMTQCFSMLHFTTSMWHTAADHTNLHCTPPFRETHSALCAEPIWERKEASLEVILSRGDYINRWHGGGGVGSEDGGEYVFGHFHLR